LANEGCARGPTLWWQTCAISATTGACSIFGKHTSCVIPIRRSHRSSQCSEARSGRRP